MDRQEVRCTIAEYIKAHPELTYAQIGAKLNCSTSTIGTIAREFKIIRQRRALTEVDLAKMGE
jgi:hypothetical protein